MDKRFGMAAAVLLAVGLTACSSSSNKKVSASGSAAAAPTTAAPAASGSADSTGGGLYGSPGGTTAAAGATSGAAVVTVANDPKDGQFLVGANGHTLYLFEKDQGTTTACTGGCVAVWPGLAATAPVSAGPGVDTSKLSTANAEVANQVVYNGHLLYFFSGDTAPGQINGTKIPAWYPVSPSGDKIDKD